VSLLVLDNYDSFTYNVVHQLEQLEVDFRVFRNDKIQLDQAANYDTFLFSPGPGLPKDAGIMPELIARFSGKKKMLGICLGMQGILEHLGCSLINMPEVLHGRSTEIRIANHSGLFKDIPREINVGRYHSWAVKEMPDTLKSDVMVSAFDSHNYFMAFEYPKRMQYGIQFHPESIMTEHGLQMIKNWISL